MVNRVKQVINLKNLTPSHFADHIGVPRSTISHILSGRNKPSLEVVQKILEAFPDISTEWLVKGTGNISISSPTLFSNFENMPDINPVDHEDIDDNPHIKQLDKGSSSSVETGALSAEKDGIKEEKRKENIEKSKEIKQTESIAIDTRNESVKSVKSVKIIIVYSDGTYTEYLPATKN